LAVTLPQGARAGLRRRRPRPVIHIARDFVPVVFLSGADYKGK